MNKQPRPLKHKTPRERAQYFETTNRRTISPTLENTIVEIDTTDAVTAEGYEPTGNLTSHRAKSRLSHIIREKWGEIIISVLLAAIIGLLGWMSSTLSSLNRETGELKTRLSETRDRVEKLQQELEKTEARLQREMDKTSDRLDRVAEKSRASDDTAIAKP